MSTQMSPTDFHDRLDDALRAPGDPALGVAVDDIARGRRLLRRRRGVTVLGAAAAVAVLVSGMGLMTGHGDDPAPTATDAAAGNTAGPFDEASVLRACRTGAPGQREATAAIFGPGTPVVKSVSRTEWSTLLTLESADGASWAWCDLHPTAGHKQNQAGSDPSLDTMLVAYDPTERTTEWPVLTMTSFFKSGPDVFRGCRDNNEVCPEFALSVADRVPTSVAAVQFRTGDGKVTTVETVDGYYALDYIGDLPRVLPSEEFDRRFPRFIPLQRITYLDAAGDPIAGLNLVLNAAGNDTTLEPVPGLPPLSEFPSLRGDPF